MKTPHRHRAAARRLAHLLLLLLPVLAAPACAGQRPADLLNLAPWKLTLPTDTRRPGNPDEIRQPALATYRDPRFFDTLPDGPAVLCRANCGGVPTHGSHYARTELREMDPDGRTPAAWSLADGLTHTLSVRLAVTQLPPHKPQVICAQIHDAVGKFLAVRLKGPRLLVEADGHDDVTLSDNYALGTPFTIQITVSRGTVRVAYNGREAALWQDNRSGCYFKTGCYIQSNTQTGDLPESTAAVLLYDVQVSHK